MESPELDNDLYEEDEMETSDDDPEVDIDEAISIAARTANGDETVEDVGPHKTWPERPRPTEIPASSSASANSVRGSITHPSPSSSPSRQV
jgi:hypothetical protein